MNVMVGVQTRQFFERKYKQFQQAAQFLGTQAELNT